MCNDLYRAVSAGYAGWRITIFVKLEEATGSKLEYQICF